MLSIALSALALSVTSAHAYENSSPFFLYSTSSVKFASIPDVAAASSIDSALKEFSRSCPTQNYLVVSQPGVSTNDFSCPQNTPLLRERLSATHNGQTSIQVRDVVDTIDTFSFVSSLAKGCGLSPQSIDANSMLLPELENSSDAHVFFTDLPTLSADLDEQERHVVLLQNDNFVSSIIDQYFGDKDYTLVYTTSSKHSASDKEVTSEGEQYQAEIPIAEILHGGELRRSLVARNEKSTTNQTIVDGPLFDKYQFLSPGIFMGGFVALLLLSILYVGISALSSLQVTYAAFDKEQGQLAAKKQQ